MSWACAAQLCASHVIPRHVRAASLNIVRRCCRLLASAANTELDRTSSRADRYNDKEFQTARNSLDAQMKKSWQCQAEKTT